MKTKGLIFLFAFALLMPASSYAQVGNLLKNKMSKVVNAGVKAADKEVDAAIDTAVSNEADKAHAKAQERTEQNKQNNNQPSDAGGTGSDTGESGGAGMLGNMFSNKVDLKYNEDYSFTSMLYMVTETYDKKDVIKMDLFMFYSSNSPSVAVETKSITSAEGESMPIAALMIVDGENKCFLALTEVNGMKMGMISEVPDENAVATDKKGKKDNPPVYTKTGNTRMVAGYKCNEYSYVDPDDKTKGLVWFTKDARLKIDRNGWKNTSMSAYYGNPDFNGGIILANEAYDDKGKLTMKSETKEINENYPHSVSVKGYSLRQINLGGKSGKK